MSDVMQDGTTPNGGVTPGDATTLTKKDFTSDQEVRWCPGCGDYAILSSVQGFMPELGIEPHKTVFVSGIGCSGRFTYYMDTYGMHGIHGRAPALATGIAVASPELSVWVVTGDGDGLSIGGKLDHALRRNVDIRSCVQQPDLRADERPVLADVGRGQGHEVDAVRVGRPPFNPIALALGVEATFVARTRAQRPPAPDRGLRRAAQHKETAFIEIYQNCTSSTTAVRPAAREGPGKHTRSVGARRADRVRRGDRCVAVVENGRTRSRSRPRRAGAHRGARCARTSVAAIRTRTLSKGPTSHRASACSTRSSARCTGKRYSTSSGGHRAPGPATREALSSGDTGRWSSPPGSCDSPAGDGAYASV